MSRFLCQIPGNRKNSVLRHRRQREDDRRRKAYRCRRNLRGPHSPPLHRKRPPEFYPVFPLAHRRLCPSASLPRRRQHAVEDFACLQHPQCPRLPLPRAQRLRPARSQPDQDRISPASRQALGIPLLSGFPGTRRFPRRRQRPQPPFGDRRLPPYPRLLPQRQLEIPLISWKDMQEVNVGIVGLGNVGSSTLAILSENGDQIALKLGYRLKVVAVCSRSVHTKHIPAGLGDVFKTTDWREVVAHPDVQIVAELVGGTSVAAEIVDAAIANRKSVVTANKELMAASGPEIWDRAIQAGINLAMEASVCGGIDDL